MSSLILPDGRWPFTMELSRVLDLGRHEVYVFRATVKGRPIGSWDLLQGGAMSQDGRYLLLSAWGGLDLKAQPCVHPVIVDVQEMRVCAVGVDLDDWLEPIGLEEGHLLVTAKRSRVTRRLALPDRRGWQAL